MKSILLFAFSCFSLSVQSQNEDSLNKLLQGRMGCLAFKNNELAKPKIHTRCGPTMTTANEPLIILDGMPLEKGALSTVNPNNIESITVLKDASAQALYGCRAVNGVILITSRKAKDCLLRFLDAADSLPISGATIAVKSEWNTITNISNKEGGVLFPSRLQGKVYRMNATCVGYLSAEEAIRFDSSKQTLTLYLKRAYPKMDTLVLSSGVRRFRCRCCGMIVTRLHNHALPEKPDAVFSFSVFPNPVTKGNNVNVVSPQNLVGQYQIVSISGQVLETRLVNLLEKQSLCISTIQWPCGVYLFRFIDDSSHKTYTQKFVVQ